MWKVALIAARTTYPSRCPYENINLPSGVISARGLAHRLLSPIGFVLDPWRRGPERAGMGISGPIPFQQGGGVGMTARQKAIAAISNHKVASTDRKSVV